MVTVSAYPFYQPISVYVNYSYKYSIVVVWWAIVMSTLFRNRITNEANLTLRAGFRIHSQGP